MRKITLGILSITFLFVGALTLSSYSSKAINLAEIVINA